MDEASSDSPMRRSSLTLSGMFPFLQKQSSMDTDLGMSDRARKAGGGKVKPGSSGGTTATPAAGSGSAGKHFSRASSGDVTAMDESPLPEQTPLPSGGGWGGGRDSVVQSSWPGASPMQLQTTPTRGLFSKLLSKKKKTGCVSPAAPDSPCLGPSRSGSLSPSSASAELLPAGAVLPHHLHHRGPQLRASAGTVLGREGSGGCAEVLDADADDQDSCYSTPAESEGASSPPRGYGAGASCYGGDTLDLQQAMYCGGGAAATPPPMRHDLPDVFTPGFNQLLQEAGGQAAVAEPDTPPPGCEEPTVALLTTAQLAQGGRVYDPHAMLVGGPALREADEQDDAAGQRCQGEQEQEEARLEATAAQPSAGSWDAAAAVGSPAAASTAEEAVEEQIVAPACPDGEASPAQALAPPAPLQQQQQQQQQEEAVEAASGSREVSPTSVDDVRLSFVGNELAEGPAEAAAGEADVEADPKPAAADRSDSAASGCDAASEDGDAASVEQCAGSTARTASAANSGRSSPEAAALLEERQLAATLPEPPSEAVSGRSTPAEASTASEQGAAPEQQQQQLASRGSDDEQEEAAAVAAAAAAHGRPASAYEDDEAQQEEEQVEQQQQQQAEDASVAAESEEPCAVDSDHFGAACGPELLAEDSALSASSVGLPGVDAPAVCSSPEAEEDDRSCADQDRGSSPAGGAASCCSLGSPPAPAPECSDSSLQLMGGDEPLELASEASGGAATLPGDGAAGDSPRSARAAASAAVPAPGGGDSPVHVSASRTTPGNGTRRLRQSPMSLVRESMPLFLADPSRAVGSPLAIDPSEEDSLDAQDMLQLAGSGWRNGGGAGGPGRLLSHHGGAQRVAAAGGPAGFSSCLAPVEETSFSSSGSPIPEGSASLARAGSGGSSVRSDSRCTSATACLPGGGEASSPLVPRRLSGSPGIVHDGSAQATPLPASATGSPALAVPLGSAFSAYSTPTLAIGASFSQDAATPHSDVSSAVGSAIRPIGSPAAGPAPGVLDLTPAGAGGAPQASPTLTLLPNLGAGGLATPANEGGDGTTPSLLDARAASPSAVYATRFTATPFRGALAALPLDAALAAPLVDSSPLCFGDEPGGADTVRLADEAQRVAANLAAVAGGFGASPVRTPAVSIPQPPACPGSAGGAASGAAGGAVVGSPTEELRDLHVVMLTKQLAELQKRTKELEGDNLRLREQVEIYEFEKTELNSQEEMEKAARQYAEEQLQAAQVELQGVLQAKAGQAADMLAMREEFEAAQRQAQQVHEEMRGEAARLQEAIARLQEERNQSLDRLNLVDMQVTAMRSNNSDLSAALEAEQARCAELEALVAARDRELAEAARCHMETQAKLEKAMEQMIAANTAKEHARQKAADEAAKVQHLVAERQQLLLEREKRAAEYGHLKHKYSHKSAALKEAEAKLAAKEGENQELMAMCDQLLQQQESRRT